MLRFDFQDKEHSDRLKYIKTILSNPRVLEKIKAAAKEKKAVDKLKKIKEALADFEIEATVTQSVSENTKSQFDEYAQWYVDTNGSRGTGGKYDIDATKEKLYEEWNKKTGIARDIYLYETYLCLTSDEIANLDQIMGLNADKNNATATKTKKEKKLKVLKFMKDKGGYGIENLKGREAAMKIILSTASYAMKKNSSNKYVEQKTKRTAVHVLGDFLQQLQHVQVTINDYCDKAQKYLGGGNWKRTDLKEKSDKKYHIKRAKYFPYASAAGT